MVRRATSLRAAAAVLSLGCLVDLASPYSCSNYRVAGAGTAGASGLFLEASGNEFSDSVPYYYKTGTAGGDAVFLFRDLDGGQRYWLVMDSAQISAAALGGASQVHYYALSSAATPPTGAASGWSSDAGALPVPSVARVATPFAYDAAAGGCVRTCTGAQKAAAAAAASGCSYVTISGAGTASANGVYYRVLPSSDGATAGGTDGLSDCASY
jgi:hypothetical protein